MATNAMKSVVPNLSNGLELQIEGVTVLGDAKLLRLVRQRGNAHDMRRFEALMRAACVTSWSLRMLPRLHPVTR